jgi:DNA-binding transcriptional ArsR family regulator
MTSQSHLESFIGNSFRSVWALEVLQFLVENPDAKFSPEELNAALRVSDAVVSQSVGNLSAAGLAVVDDDGKISLFKGTRSHRELVKEAIDFYRKSPDKVRRLIVAQSTPGVTAFADAFKLRGD